MGCANEGRGWVTELKCELGVPSSQDRGGVSLLLWFEEKTEKEI